MKLVATGIAAASLLALAAPVSAQSYGYVPQSYAYEQTFGSGSTTDYPTPMPGDNSADQLNREALPLAEGVTTYPSETAQYSDRDYAPNPASYEPYMAPPAPQPYAPMNPYPGIAPAPAPYPALYPPPG